MVFYTYHFVFTKMKNTMVKTKTLTLSSEELASLEKGYRYGSCHRFRMRCKGILMKVDNVRVKEVSTFLGYGPLAVYHWIERFRGLRL